MTTKSDKEMFQMDDNGIDITANDITTSVTTAVVGGDGKNYCPRCGLLCPFEATKSDLEKMVKDIHDGIPEAAERYGDYFYRFGKALADREASVEEVLKAIQHIDIEKHPSKFSNIDMALAYFMNVLATALKKKFIVLRREK